MGRLSVGTRDELVKAASLRYAEAGIGTSADVFWTN